MNKIEELKQTIQQQEDLASQMNHADTSGDYYKNLYELLSVSYFAAKDIIVLQEGNIPLEEDNSLEVSLHDAESTIKQLTKELVEVKNWRDEYKTKSETLEEEVRNLEHWKDGANLEGEQMKDKITALSAELHAAQVDYTDSAKFINEAISLLESAK